MENLETLVLNLTEQNSKVRNLGHILAIKVTNVVRIVNEILSEPVWTIFLSNFKVCFKYESCVPCKQYFWNQTQSYLDI